MKFGVRERGGAKGRAILAAGLPDVTAAAGCAQATALRAGRSFPNSDFGFSRTGFVYDESAFARSEPTLGLRRAWGRRHFPQGPWRDALFDDTEFIEWLELRPCAADSLMATRRLVKG